MSTWLEESKNYKEKLSGKYCFTESEQNSLLNSVEEAFAKIFVLMEEKRQLEYKKKTITKKPDYYKEVPSQEFGDSVKEIVYSDEYNEVYNRLQEIDHEIYQIEKDMLDANASVIFSQDEIDEADREGYNIQDQINDALKYRDISKMNKWWPTYYKQENLVNTLVKKRDLIKDLIRLSYENSRKKEKEDQIAAEEKRKQDYINKYKDKEIYIVDDVDTKEHPSAGFFEPASHYYQKTGDNKARRIGFVNTRTTAAPSGYRSGEHSWDAFPDLDTFEGEEQNIDSLNVRKKWDYMKPDIDNIGWGYDDSD